MLLLALDACTMTPRGKLGHPLLCMHCTRKGGTGRVEQTPLGPEAAQTVRRGAVRDAERYTFPKPWLVSEQAIAPSGFMLVLVLHNAHNACIKYRYEDGRRRLSASQFGSATGGNRRVVSLLFLGIVAPGTCLLDGGSGRLAAILRGGRSAMTPLFLVHN